MTEQASQPVRKKKIAVLLVKVLRVVLGGSLLLLAGLSLVSFLGRTHLLELTSHFRVLYLIAAVIGVVIGLALRTKALTAVAPLLVIAHAIPIISYYRTPQVEATGPTRPVKVMLSNVAVGNTGYGEFLSLVAAEDPDLLIIQEFTPAWENATVGLKTTYPYSLFSAKQGGAGIALFSRFPLVDAHFIDFDGSAHDGIFARVDINGVFVTMVAIHPLPPTREDKFASRNHQLAATATILRSASGPKFLIGDLNTSIWSPYYRDLLRDSGLRDVRRGFGLLPTWPGRLPAFVRIPIDNCLVSNEIQVERIRMGPDIGSDHLPLLAELRVPQVAK